MHRLESVGVEGVSNHKLSAHHQTSEAWCAGRAEQYDAKGAPRLISIINKN
jgi:hypothetical protein